MTRQQVAKRLGKSLATVRRLEGSRLHPFRDARGVHHFDPDEVEAIAQRIEAGEVTLWQDQGADEEPAADECSNCLALERQVTKLKAEVAETRRDHERRLAGLKASHEREARELTTAVQGLLSSLDE